MFQKKRFALGALGLFLCLLSTPSWGQDAGDRIVWLPGSQFHTAPLPFGPVSPGLVLPGTVPDLAFDAAGQVHVFQVIRDNVGGELAIATLDDQGHTPTAGFIALAEEEDPRALAFAPDGRLFVLLEVASETSPPERGQRFLEVDPQTLSFLARYEISPSFAPILDLAPSPRGLWLLTTEGDLLHYSPTANAVDDPAIDLPVPGNILAMATDSTGALWLDTASTSDVQGNVERSLLRFDPATGAMRRASFSPPETPGSMAIDRRCQPSATARCLQSGRFRATVTWRDHAADTGEGQVAPSASADSALFWFFDAANWEVLLKVIDGCTLNGHFWVFAAGTTDVEYTLEVTDLHTGEVFTTTNPLGQASEAVTDTTAFGGCP